MGTALCLLRGQGRLLWARRAEMGEFQVGLPGPLFSTNHGASVLLCPTGPSTQRQVQNGPSPEEMDIQRR